MHNILSNGDEDTENEESTSRDSNIKAQKNKRKETNTKMHHVDHITIKNLQQVIEEYEKAMVCKDCEAVKLRV